VQHATPDIAWVLAIGPGINYQYSQSTNMSGFTMKVMLTLLYVKSEQNEFGVDTYNDPFLALDNFKTHLYDLVT